MVEFLSELNELQQRPQQPKLEDCLEVESSYYWIDSEANQMDNQMRQRRTCKRNRKMDRRDNLAKQKQVFVVCLSYDDFETKPNFQEKDFSII